MLLSIIKACVLFASNVIKFICNSNICFRPICEVEMFELAILRLFVFKMHKTRNLSEKFNYKN